MWTYIFRRLLLMIPTLFGVTVVTFVIMQLAPGDPMLNQLTPGGGADKKGETRESFLIRMRDLKLDKPLLLNLRGFYDFKNDLKQAAYFRTLDDKQTAALLADMHKSPEKHARKFEFIANLDMGSFRRDLADPDKYTSLTRGIAAYSQSYFEKMGAAAVPDAMELLQDKETPAAERAELVNMLNFMVVEKVKATYSSEPLPEETQRVEAVWRLWLQRNKDEFPPLAGADIERLQQQLEKMTTVSREKLFEMTEDLPADESDTILPFFAGVLTDDAKMLPGGRKEATFREKVISAMILKLFVSRPLEMQVSKSPSPPELALATENWENHFEYRQDEYIQSTGGAVWSMFTDTQYVHMVWRLVTFDFGRSALTDRALVRDKLWAAVWVSAPLMVMANLIIYFVAVPIGVTCAVNHRTWIDTSSQFGLFLLYSVPPFVAAMLFLLFFCYKKYLNIFPMQRLHSSGADDYALHWWLLDYAWHAFLPVVCLSLFSLAVIAMYARTSLLEVIQQDYIRTARAKGVSNFWVTYKHAFRNAMIPILTLFSNILPAMLGGSVLIEYLFNIPGMGKLGFESIANQDYPTVMALVYVQAIVVLLTILLTDVLYVFVDPRISLEGK